MNTSWVIVSMATGQPVMETYSQAIVDKVNRSKYFVFPILEWLQFTARKAKEST